jgi:stage V sporulation protein AD
VGGCIGKVADLDVTDINNMGSAMAPAAADTITRYLAATKTTPADYDYIVTGDLGIVGSQLLLDFLMKQGIDISAQHKDCGAMIFDPQQQDTHCGGSGCGCSASVLCGHFIPMLQRRDAENILFAATGALMSPMSLQQGESIPAISHLVHLRKERS